MADVVVLVWLEEDGAGGVAVPAWATRALGLDVGQWECEITADGRVALRPVLESTALAPEPEGPHSTPVA